MTPAASGVHRIRVMNQLTQTENSEYQSTPVEDIVEAPTPTHGDPEQDAELLAATLAVVVEQAQDLLRRLARGTREIPVQAPSAQPAALTLRERICHALQKESLSIRDLAKELGEPLAAVSAEVKRLRQGRQVHNVGSEDYPVWNFKIGDGTTSNELRKHIERLISERPMTTAELADATGARIGRVGGQLGEIQYSGKQVVDLGTPLARRWFLITERARDARLPRPTKASRNRAS